MFSFPESMEKDKLTHPNQETSLVLKADSETEEIQKLLELITDHILDFNL